MRYQENEAQRKANWREAIVLTSAELFLKEGIEPVSMARIAGACDIGVATLYRYYGTKAGIVLEVGTLLWGDLMRLFNGDFETDGYQRQPGMAQLEELLGFFLRVYREHQPFLRFVHQFDQFVRSEKIPPEKLEAYQNSILDLYPLFAAAYQKACAEGTARPGLAVKTLYAAIAHALLAVSQKFLEGDILPEDQSADKEAELRQLIDMILYYVKA